MSKKQTTLKELYNKIISETANGDEFIEFAHRLIMRSEGVDEALKWIREQK